MIAVAVVAAAVFATLWVRSPDPDQREILVIDLSAAPNYDGNMPYPIRLLDRNGKTFAGVDHHGTPKALPISASRCPIVVVGGFGGCRSKKVKATPVAV